MPDLGLSTKTSSLALPICYFVAIIWFVRIVSDDCRFYCFDNAMLPQNQIPIYLHMSVLAQIIIAIMKSCDGVSTPDANNSNSQFMPVYPNGQSHSYFCGGFKSVQTPPFWHGCHRHSFSLMHCVPDILKPAGQLKFCNFCISKNKTIPIKE